MSRPISNKEDKNYGLTKVFDEYNKWFNDKPLSIFLEETISSEAIAQINQALWDKMSNMVEDKIKTNNLNHIKGEYKCNDCGNTTYHFCKNNE